MVHGGGSLMVGHKPKKIVGADQTTSPHLVVGFSPPDCDSAEIDTLPPAIESHGFA